MKPRTALAAYFFVNSAAFGLFQPFLPLWLAARGVAGVDLGLVAATRPVTSVLAPIAFGMIADRLGLRGSLLRLAGLGSMAALIALTLLCWKDPQPEFLALTFLMTVFSFFRAPMASLADVAALEGETSFGRQRFWGSFGFFVAVWLCGRLVNTSEPLPFLLSVMGLLVVTMGFAFALPRRAKVAARPVLGAARSLLIQGDFLWFLLGIFLWQASHSAYDLCFPLHLKDDLQVSSNFIGIALALGTAAETVLMVISAPWIERHGTSRLLVVGVALAALRWLLIATLKEPWMILALQPLHAASFALVFLAAMEHVKRRADPHILGTAQGAFTAVNGVGAATSMLVWGHLHKLQGSSAVFLWAAVVALIACGVFLLQMLRQPERSLGSSLECSP